MHRTRNPAYGYAVSRVRIPPLPPDKSQQTKVAGIFLWLFENGPIPGRGQGSVFLFSEEQNGCTKSDSHAGAAGKPGAADDSERRNVGEPRNDNDDTGNRGQRAKEFA